MGWDSSRPVPWRRLLKEYVIYAAIMAVILLLLFRDRGAVGLLLGLVLALPLYLALGAVLAKFGYQRTSLTGRRVGPAPSTAVSAGNGHADTTPRPRPAPTRRTSAGSNRPQRRRR